MPQFITQRLIARYRDHSLSYSLVEPHGRPHIVCPQCRSVVLFCDHLSVERRREIAQAWRGPLGIAVASRLLKADGFDLAASKAIIFHVPRRPFHCVNCGQEHPEGALLCAQCMAVNLPW